MPGRHNPSVQDCNRYWRFVREMRRAEFVGDRDKAAECRDEIEVIALHTASDSVRQSCMAALDRRATIESVAVE